MNQRTRKLMTMQKAVYPRDDGDRLYVPRKEGGKIFTSIQESVDASIKDEKTTLKKSEKDD